MMRNNDVMMIMMGVVPAPYCPAPTPSSSFMEDAAGFKIGS